MAKLTLTPQQREVVENKHWATEEELVDELTTAARRGA